MKQRVAILLIGINLVLLGWLVFALSHPSQRQDPGTSPTPSPEALPETATSTATELPAQKAPAEPPTPFAQVYSPDPRTFAANLRAIRCPDQTVIDILKAEIHRRFAHREEALRPTPADHVPFTWDARPAEPRLAERRQAAAALAREEGGFLRGALGCEAAVSMPLYAMTTSDVRFEAALAESPHVNTCSVRESHDNYWAQVEALLDRTKGFWLPEDVAELNQFKAMRKQQLADLWKDIQH